MKTNTRKGFTLIELLITIVIIGTLSGVILTVINVSGLRARSRDAQRVGDIKKIQTALELYFADNRGYPPATSWTRIITSTTFTPGGSFSNFPATYVTFPQDPRDNETYSGTACGGPSVYGYYYRTSSCGTDCVSTTYVLRSYMESTSAADQSLCSSLSNCLGASPNISGCNCATPCYGVQNPL